MKKEILKMNFNLNFHWKIHDLMRQALGNLAGFPNSRPAVI